MRPLQYIYAIVKYLLDGTIINRVIIYVFIFFLQDGKPIPLDVQVGDRVLLPEYGGTKIQLDEDDSYTIFKESELLAKVNIN